jgi:hypothetical protein
MQSRGAGEETRRGRVKREEVCRRGCERVKMVESVEGSSTLRYECIHEALSLRPSLHHSLLSLFDPASYLYPSLYSPSPLLIPARRLPKDVRSLEPGWGESLEYIIAQVRSKVPVRRPLTVLLKSLVAECVVSQAGARVDGHRRTRGSEFFNFSCTELC